MIQHFIEQLINGLQLGFVYALIALGYTMVYGIIREINQDGTTVVLVEQNAFMALSIAHRGYVLEVGQVVLEGPARELQQHPSVRKAHLGEAVG